MYFFFFVFNSWTESFGDKSIFDYLECRESWAVISPTKNNNILPRNKRYDWRDEYSYGGWIFCTFHSLKTLRYLFRFHLNFSVVICNRQDCRQLLTQTDTELKRHHCHRRFCCWCLQTRTLFHCMFSLWNIFRTKCAIIEMV